MINPFIFQGSFRMDVYSVLLCCILLLAVYKVLDFVIRIPVISVPPGTRKYVVITGCDTGFGAIFARQMSCKSPQYYVLASCFHKKAAEDLNNAGYPNLKAFQMDVTSSSSINTGLEFVQNVIGNGGGR